MQGHFIGLLGFQASQGVEGLFIGTSGTAQGFAVHGQSFELEIELTEPLVQALAQAVGVHVSEHAPDGVVTPFVTEPGRPKCKSLFM